MSADSNKNCLGGTGSQSRRKTRAQLAKDCVFTNETEHLKGRLEQVPGIRAVKVSWGKVLLSDPSYPQDAVLNRVADVLSKHIEIPRGE
jgi:hypothetical protein